MYDVRQRRTERDVDLHGLRNRPGNWSSRWPRRRSGAARATAAQGPPVHVSITGGLVITGSLILLVLAVIQSTKTESPIQFLWLALGVVSGYGVYAAVQFIRGKSAKLLIAALTLGVVVDVMTLIALPLLQPFIQEQETIVKPIVPEGVDDASVGIQPFEERIDLKRIMFGIGLVLVYAAFSIYLISPPVKKYIHIARRTCGSSQTIGSIFNHVVSRSRSGFRPRSLMKRSRCPAGSARSAPAGTGSGRRRGPCWWRR